MTKVGRYRAGGAAKNERHKLYSNRNVSHSVSHRNEFHSEKQFPQTEEIVSKICLTKRTIGTHRLIHSASFYLAPPSAISTTSATAPLPAACLPRRNRWFEWNQQDDICTTRPDLDSRPVCKQVLCNVALIPAQL